MSSAPECAEGGIQSTDKKSLLFSFREYSISTPFLIQWLIPMHTTHQKRLKETVSRCSNEWQKDVLWTGQELRRWATSCPTDQQSQSRGIKVSALICLCCSPGSLSLFKSSGLFRIPSSWWPHDPAHLKSHLQRNTWAPAFHDSESQKHSGVGESYTRPRNHASTMRRVLFPSFFPQKTVTNWEFIIRMGTLMSNP
jgi:hypothetical protein